MLKTNENKLVMQSVAGQITHPMSGKTPYRVSVDGVPMVLPGTGGITYNFRVGDCCTDLVGDHVEPGVSLSNFSNPANRQELINGGLNVLACIGNEALVISGKAEGAKGTVTGKHGGIEHVLVDFDDAVLNKLNIEDKIGIKAFGVGLALLEFPGIKVMNLSPSLLKKMKLKKKGAKLEVPVTHFIPAAVMGSGIGADNCYRGDYDIQMFDDKTVKKYKMESLRFGDIVAIEDADHSFGRAYRQGCVSIGIVVHSRCVLSGHGPGVTTLMTTKDSSIIPVIDKDANIATLLGLRKTKRK